MNGGTETVDATTGSHVPTGDQAAAKVQRQVGDQVGLTGAAGGGGTVFTEPILVVT